VNKVFKQVKRAEKILNCCTQYLSKQQSTQTGLYTIAACSPFQPMKKNVWFSRIFFQNFSGPQALISRTKVIYQTFQVVELSRKKSRTFQDFPGGMGTLPFTTYHLATIHP